ncbi:ABC-3 protein [Beutenbergia cavernae DSM 12333]|uniref:ABC-3 protein n=1 Tax=Beutenbergia cavernae (strain ATCC BAA-8 / DSM 12333 / CCUG 43141 / JCM 11478 / NBRC 16432 / NCIMB 13614 / HKI 0122) TaxID=471853 RepID=C5C4Q1_BEUC1|nr:metal ABC transporter permease [Beutenbergia cavernae]ACQ80029.1 ABC-3 protein [Beutenbergia cavernae DSM 12333]
MTDWQTVTEMLTSPLMQRALIAAALVGLAAPVIGTYLVQRRLALLGDGVGHVALTGVAAGWLVGNAMALTPHDVLAIPGAIVAAVVGAILIEVVRARGRTSGDVALALLFYGGIAGGVLLIGIAGGTNANLMAYLFGSISTVSVSDLWLIVGMGVGVLVVGLGLRTALFAVCQDEDFARSTGLPVRALNLTIAVVAALTVTVSMRVVGLLLVSAVMIVPVAVAQLVASSFGRTMAVAMGVGVVVCVTGLVITYIRPLAPGAMIVVLAIALYAVTAALRPVVARVRGRAATAHRDPHPDLPDDVVLTKEGS